MKFVIEDCKKVGIRVVVIIGDNKSIVEVICWEIGFFVEDEDLFFKLLIGRDFMKLLLNERREFFFGDRNKGLGFVFFCVELIYK